MKDFKTSLLILLSLLLLLAVLLLGTVFYHFYYKKPEYKPVLELTSKNEIIIGATSRDSLYRRYTMALENLGDRLDSAFTKADSVNTDFDSRIGEFYKLREEIAVILKKENVHPDLQKAGAKINELREKLASLRFVSRDVETENKRLAQLIAQLQKPESIGAAGPTLVPLPKLASKQTSSGPGHFTVTDLNLFALGMTNDHEEVETKDAKIADKMAGSFVLRYHQAIPAAELMVVIVQPDGKVFQGPAWDAGSFTTSEGKKIYSRKFSIDYKKGESRKIAFSLAGDDIQKGEYAMQVYQNGILIGGTRKVLL